MRPSQTITHYIDLLTQFRIIVYICFVTSGDLPESAPDIRSLMKPVRVPFTRVE